MTFKIGFSFVGIYDRQIANKHQLKKGCCAARILLFEKLSISNYLSTLWKILQLRTLNTQTHQRQLSP
jgi:hypothetical protein